MFEVDQLENVPNGYRIRICVDGDPENPRNMCDDSVHVLSIPSRDYVDVDRDPGPWGSAWQGLLARYVFQWHRDRDPDRAVEVVQRWARINGAYTYDHAPHDGVRSVWYLTREDAERERWTDPVAALKAYADEYEAWTRGDVYGYVVEQLVTWQRQDDPTMTEERWEHLDSCWGFYGNSDGTREDMESSARAVLAAYMAAV
jgi:hypothetical protein